MLCLLVVRYNQERLRVHEHVAELQVLRAELQDAGDWESGRRHRDQTSVPRRRARRRISGSPQRSGWISVVFLKSVKGNRENVSHVQSLCVSVCLCVSLCVSVCLCVSLCAGPQDQGWCSGYTCQQRVSLFHSIVATGHSFDVFFSSVSPQKLRLMLLNADPTEVRKITLN